MVLWTALIHAPPSGLAAVSSSMTMTPYVSPHQPSYVTVAGDGNLWFTEKDAQAIGRLCRTVSTTSGCTAQGHIDEYSLPLASLGASAGFGQLQDPFQIVTGADGNVWFETQLATVDRMCIGVSVTTACAQAGQLSEYHLPPDSQCGGEFQQQGMSALTAGPDGNIWFVVACADRTGRLGRLTPPGTIPADPSDLSPVPQIVGSLPHAYSYGGHVSSTQLTGTGNGDGLIITSEDSPDIAVTDLKGTVLGSCDVPGASSLRGVVAAAGSYWVAGAPSSQAVQPTGAVWRVSPAAPGALTSSGAPPPCDQQPAALEQDPLQSIGMEVASGSDGAVWATELRGSLARVCTSTDVSSCQGGVRVIEYSISQALGISSSYPLGIVPGPDASTLWFTDAGDSALVRAVIPQPARGSPPPSSGGTATATATSSATSSPTASSTSSPTASSTSSPTASATSSPAPTASSTAGSTLGPPPTSAPPTTYGLTVNRTAGSGLGTVTGGAGSNPDIECGTGSGCSHAYPGGTEVTLQAAPASDSSFVAWSGCDRTSGSQCSVTMGSDRVVSATFTIIDTEQYDRFVELVYHDLFDRVADSGGLSYWAGTTRSGAPRDEIAVDFTSSDEYRMDQVAALYEHYLHRAPDAGGQRYWANYIANGATYEDLIAAMVGSDEYWQLHGSDPRLFVDAVYLDVLARQADPQGEAYWTKQIESGAPHAAIANDFSHSQEYYQLLVGEDYERYLRRPADSYGLNYWVNAFEQGVRDERMVSNFIGSDEYFNWAQTH